MACIAALLAQGRHDGERAARIDGPQGFLRAMDSERTRLGDAIADLGSRWEIVDTGITVKLYPVVRRHASRRSTPSSTCAGASDSRRTMSSAIDIDVDSITPTILIYDRPATGLEGKFSMPFCAAAAVVYGRVGLDTFEAATLDDPAVSALMPRVAMRVDPRFDGAARR